MAHLGHVTACGRDAVVDTAKYIGGRLTAPVGGEHLGDTFDSAKPDTHKAARDAGNHGKGLVDQARDAVGDAKARLNKAAEDAARSAQEAADSVRPHTIEVLARPLSSARLALHV